MNYLFYVNNWLKKVIIRYIVIRIRGEIIMGKRYRKSIKICKGVRMNLSKSGPSLSLGGRGCSVNINKHGVRNTVGIPGTGLSYSSYTKLDQPRNSRKRRTTTTNTSSNTIAHFQLRMDDKGKVEIYDDRGVLLTDSSFIRRIKATPEYKAEVESLDIQRRKRIDDIVKKSQKDEIDRYINIYKLTPTVRSRSQFEKEIERLKPKKYTITAYSKQKPNELLVRHELEEEAQDSVKGFFLFVGKKRKQYVEDHYQERFDEKLNQWNKENDLHIEQENKKKQELDIQFQKEYEQRKMLLINKMNGSEEDILNMFDKWVSSINLPVEMNINYEWNNDDKAFNLDVDLPEIEDLPATVMVKNASGNIKEKKKTQAELKNEYAQVVFGLAMYISGHVFNISPVINKIQISGYTQRKKKTGDIFDCYIYSIRFNRSDFEHKRFSNINPVEFCMSVENRSNMTTTGLLREIKPFE